jgi:prepilin-type processing-associated H-X9-DG protein/prepilin-type N-terminal cleavage/methylation domain-containing protein
MRRTEVNRSDGVRAGWTLLETIIVMAIFGVLAGMLIPAVQMVRQRAGVLSCQANLKQMGLGLHGYHDLLKRLPPSTGNISSDRSSTPPVVQWTVLILPYVDQAGLWNEARRACGLSPLTYLNPPHAVAGVVPPLYACPADGRGAGPLKDRNGITAAFTSYLGVGGGTRGDGVMTIGASVRLTDVMDGTSNTLMIGERPFPDSLEAGWWYSAMGSSSWPDFGQRGPNASMPVYIQFSPTPCVGPFQFGPGRGDNPCDRYHFWSSHGNGANFAFADGSVHFISYTARSVLRELATRNGGEPISGEW